MLGASLLPERFRGYNNHGASSKPGYINRQITSILQGLASQAFTHPIHTIVSVAVLASTSYIGLLEGSLSGLPESVSGPLGSASLGSLLENGRNLSIGVESSWRWKVVSEAFRGATDGIPVVTASPKADNGSPVKQLALLTLVFPESLSAISPRKAPAADVFRDEQDFSSTLLPSTPNALASITQDTTLAFSVPLQKASKFLSRAQELPAQPSQEDLEEPESRNWVMQAINGDGTTSERPFQRWVSRIWINFVDLIRVR